LGGAADNTAPRPKLRILGKMTITFDKAVYVNLLADFVPEVINSEAEYDRALAIAERLVANRNLSNEESKFLSLIVTLIEDYEGKHYPMGDVSPHAALLHLMEKCDSLRVNHGNQSVYNLSKLATRHVAY
jgi:hypothetical protein